VRHAVGGADYVSVRVGAFMGYRILADAAGMAVTAAGDGRVSVRDPRWGGYLANVTPAVFAEEFERLVPERLGGAEFLARFGGITDPITRVVPGRSYAVRAATAHPIREHARVTAFAGLLRDAAHTPSLADGVAARLGALMYESHASYSACGLGSSATDRLVAMVRARGAAAGLYGAKITGGGSGGTVAVLGHRDAAPAVLAMAEAFARERALEGDAPVAAARVFSGSSPGAVHVPVLRVRRPAT
jgi:galactokinase